MYKVTLRALRFLRTRIDCFTRSLFPRRITLSMHSVPSGSPILPVAQIKMVRVRGCMEALVRDTRLLWAL